MVEARRRFGRTLIALAVSVPLMGYLYVQCSEGPGVIGGVREKEPLRPADRPGVDSRDDRTSIPARVKADLPLQLIVSSFVEVRPSPFEFTKTGYSLTWVRGRIGEVVGEPLHGQLYLFGNVDHGDAVLDECVFRSGHPFEMTTILPQAFEIYARVKGQGFLQKLETSFSPKGGHFDLGTLLLKPGMQIRGEVQSPSGNPIMGARVRLTRHADRGPLADRNLPQEEPAVIVTDQTGGFEFENVPAGIYKVVVRKKGYPPIMRHLILRPNAEFNSNILVKMEPGWVLSGRVVDSNGKAIESAKIGAGRESGDPAWTETISDAVGRFMIRATEKMLVLKIEKEGFAPTWIGRVRPYSRTQEFRVSRGYRITGRVSCGKDELEAPAMVSLVGRHTVWGELRYEAKTDLQGGFEVKHVAAGRYHVEVYDKRFGMANDVIDVPKMKEVWLRFPPRRSVTFQAVSESGAAVAGGRVEVKQFNPWPGRALLEPIRGTFDSWGRFSVSVMSGTTLLWRIRDPASEQSVSGVATAKDGAVHRILFRTHGTLVGTLALDEDLGANFRQGLMLQLISEENDRPVPVDLLPSKADAFDFRVERILRGKYRFRLLGLPSHGENAPVLVDTSEPVMIQANKILQARCRLSRN